MTDILDLIGNTPLVRLERMDAQPCELYVKLENQNPGGSIKDRIGLSMIEAAERDGKHRPGRHASSRRPPATPGWAWRWSPRARATACCW